MASWGYVFTGFALAAAGLGAYALRLQRRIARLRPERRAGRQR